MGDRRETGNCRRQSFLAVAAAAAVLQLLESLVALQHYNGVYIHRKLLPALLARLPQPTATASQRRISDRRLEVRGLLLLLRQ